MTVDHQACWWLAHLYAFCKGGNGKVGCHSFFFAATSKLALCPTIPGAITAPTSCTSSPVVVIIGNAGWPARSVAMRPPGRGRPGLRDSRSWRPVPHLAHS
jgi:hypothetical protein